MPVRIKRSEPVPGKVESITIDSKDRQGIVFWKSKTTGVIAVQAEDVLQGSMPLSVKEALDLAAALREMAEEAVESRAYRLCPDGWYIWRSGKWEHIAAGPFEPKTGESADMIIGDDTVNHRNARIRELEERNQYLEAENGVLVKRLRQLKEQVKALTAERDKAEAAGKRKEYIQIDPDGSVRVTVDGVRKKVWPE